MSFTRASFNASPFAVPPFPDRRLSCALPPLPSLRSCHHFINLTNGLEALPVLQSVGIQPAFVRIQSTLCEQGHLERLITELDATLLLRLALGQTCLIYDFGSRNKKRAAPRAIWYGLEFIKYALADAWNPDDRRPERRAFLRGHDARAAFDGHIREFSTSTKRKLKYYAQYMPSEGLEEVKLYGVYSSTSHDIDAPFYRSLAQAHVVVGADRSTPDITVDARVVMDGDLLEGVHRLLGMHVFLGGLSHAELSTWRSHAGLEAEM